MKILGRLVIRLNKKGNTKQSATLLHDSNGLLGICNIPTQRLCSTYHSQQILLIMRILAQNPSYTRL